MFLSVAAALLGGGYLYFRLDDEIRRQVERRLAAHYQGLNVHVARAHCEQDRGIAIYDLAIFEPQRDSTPQPIVSVHEIFLAGDVRMDELLRGSPQVERILIRRARLRAVRQLDGQWNVKSLLPLPDFSGQRPVLTIEDATVVLQDASRREATPFVVRDVDLTLTPLESADKTDANPRYRVLGTVTGLPAQEFRCEGEVSPADGSLNLTVTIRGLEVTPELLASLGALQAPELLAAEPSGRADVTLQISRSSAAAPLNWSAAIRVDRGRLAHSRLAEPLTDVALTATADSKRLFVDHLSARWGPAQLTLACERAGWSAAAPLGLAARLVGLPLDERLKSILPTSCARAWQRFQPLGIVDAEVRLAFDGQRWHPQVSAECRGISLTDAEKFPYPLEEAIGKLQYTPARSGNPDRLQMSLTARGAGRPVQITADLTHLAPPEPEGEAMAAGLATAARRRVPGIREAAYRGAVTRRSSRPRRPHPLGWVEIAGTDIPLHEQLVAALPEKGEQLVRSLRPHGAIDFHFRAQWTDLSQPRADVTNEIRLKDCSIQYTPFPYALHHVQGLLTEHNGHWTLHDIEARGRSDSAIVRCSGKSIPRGDGCLVDLTFNATNVPLDDNLKLALLPPAQQAWDELRPQGRVDFTAHVVHETAQAKPVIEVTLQPRANSVSVEPLRFPYRLERVAGLAKFQDGRVELSNVSGDHDRTAYSAAGGSWQATPDGGWQLQFNGVSADRLMPHRDRDLLVALPPTLQQIVERLQPRGTFALYNSSFTFARAPQQERMAAAWDVNLYSHQADIQGGVPLRSVTGAFRLVGRNDGQTVYTAGELDLDSLIWKDLQFTNVRGPIWIDPSFCLLGELASERQGQPARRLTADAYGGSLAANATLQHAVNPAYRLEVALGGADLARFASERFGGPTELSGTVSGRLSLSGTGRSTQTLNGGGELHVVDANLYELPVTVSLLKVLVNRTPTATAFNRCDMKFAIQGEHIQFQQLNLLGDAVSLYGNGETNFNRDLNLVFYTLIGPADLPIPLWKTIAGHVSQQGLQLKVVGKWDDPDVQRKALPAVNDALQHIQAQIQAGAATMAPSTAARDPVVPAR